MNHPLVIAANRDEFHARPTRGAHWWPDRPDLLAGRDLQAGGSWLALDRRGRFAAVTNHRDADPPRRRFASRGELVTGFLDGDLPPADYLAAIDGSRYGGFNLLAGDGRDLAYLSNRGAGMRELPPGLYAVANATLDATWPKTERSRGRLQAMIDDGSLNETSLFRLLGDREKAPSGTVESGGLPFDLAHALSAPFIVRPDYGTRSSTVVIADRRGSVRMSERRFHADGSLAGQSDFRFGVAQAAP